MRLIPEASAGARHGPVLPGRTNLAVAGSIYLPVVQAELDRAFFPRTAHPVAVRLFRSAATGLAIGAAAMVLQP